MKKIASLFIFLIAIYTSLAQNSAYWKPFEEAASLAEKKEFLIEKGLKSLNSQPQELATTVEKAKVLYEQSKNPEFLAIAYAAEGMRFSNSGKVDSSNVYHRKSVAELQKIPPTYLLALEYNLLSINSYRKGDFNNFSNYSDSALQLTHDLHLPDYRAILISNRAYTLVMLGRHKEALEALYKVQAQAKEKELHGLLSSVALNISYVYNKLEEKDSVKYYSREAIAEAQLSGHRKDLADTYRQIGSLYTEEADYHTAEEHFLKSRQIYEEMGVVNSMLSLDVQRARNFIDEGSYHKANLLLEQLIHDTDSLGYPNVLLSSYRLKMRYYEKQKVYDQALLFQRKTQQLKDSLNNAETRREINDLEVKYQTREKEKQLTILQQEKQIQQQEQNMLFVLLLASIVIFLILFYLLRMRYLSNQKMAQAEKEQ